MQVSFCGEIYYDNMKILGDPVKGHSSAEQDIVTMQGALSELNNGNAKIKYEQDPAYKIITPNYDVFTKENYEVEGACKKLFIIDKLKKTTNILSKHEFENEQYNSLFKACIKQLEELVGNCKVLF